MINLCRDEDYRRAVLSAELAIADSGFMVLLWKFFTGERVPRISGLEHVKRLLEHESVREPGAVLWVVATETSRDKLVEFLSGERTRLRSEEGRRKKSDGQSSEAGSQSSAVSDSDVSFQSSAFSLRGIRCQLSELSFQRSERLRRPQIFPTDRRRSIVGLVRQERPRSTS